MKTNIFELDGRYFTKTGKVFVYEEPFPIFDNDGDIVDYDYLYSYVDEIVDVCTGEKFNFDDIMFFEIGNPIDAYNERRAPKKRGRHSRSHNKQSGLLVRKVLPWEEDLPF